MEMKTNIAGHASRFLSSMKRVLKLKTFHLIHKVHFIFCSLQLDFLSLNASRLMHDLEVREALKELICETKTRALQHF